MISDVNRVFYIEKDAGTVEVRYPSLKNPVHVHTLLAIDAFRSVHRASGIGSNDFGMFVAVEDDGQIDSESFLVTQTSPGGNGMLVPSDMVLAQPFQHFTKELAIKVASLGHDELGQFGLGSLAEHVHRNYPDMRALR